MCGGRGVLAIASTAAALSPRPVAILCLVPGCGGGAGAVVSLAGGVSLIFWYSYC